MRTLLPYLAFYGPMSLVLLGWLCLVYLDYKHHIMDGAAVAFTVIVTVIIVLILAIWAMTWGYGQLHIPEAQ